MSASGTETLFNGGKGHFRRRDSDVGPGPRDRQTEGFSPAQVLLIVILVAALSQSAGILLEYVLREMNLVARPLIHSFEMTLFLAMAYAFLYRPLSHRLQVSEGRVEEMREREQHLRLALEGGKSGLWDWDLASGAAYYTPSGELILGYQPGELPHSIQTWKDLLHPEERETILQTLNDHLEGRTPGYETEHRLRSKTGEWIWFHSLGRVTLRDHLGRPRRMVGTFNNIDDRKRAEAQIHLLWQQLDRAGEMERTRLARDLHDQLGQLVTLLQLQLEVFRRSLQDAPSLDRCRTLIDLTSQLGAEIRNVAARLRPPALDAGLVPALRYDLARLNGHLTDLRISLQAEDLERERLDPEVEITLFRIYQEALNNTVKHAQAQTVDIRLQRLGPEITLSVQDDGVGFDPRSMLDPKRTHRGIGLLGMQERVAALGGQLEISSRPNRGTRIRVHLQARPPAASEGADGGEA